MKKILLALYSLFIASGMYGQDPAALTDGFHVFKYPNGAVSSQGLIKDGKPEGFWTSYYVTGVKKSEGKRTNHMLDSLWIFYDQTGDTTEKISYLDGKKNGWYLKYKKDPGTGIYIWSKELYAGDRKEGLSYVYYPDGKIQQTIGYNEGKKEGLSKEFDREGNVLTLMEYNNDFLISREKINRTDAKGLKQGSWKDFYPNGAIKSEKSYKDDQLSGYYKEYDNRGRLVLTMLYDNGSIVKNDVEDAPDIEIVNKHDNDGKLIYSGPYRNNVPVGIHREYGKDGKITNAWVYTDNGLKVSEGIVDEAGNRNGKWKDLFPNGKVQSEGQYTDNRRTGMWKFYNSEGKTEQTGGYNNGRPDGLWKWYYENNALLREEEYFQGRRDGAYTEYSPNGEVLTQGQFTDGEKNGDWILKNGDNREEGKYILGLRDGVWKSYYAEGKLKSKGNFIQGNPDGSHVFYYENGKIREEQYYEMGIREKTWKKYDEEGNTVVTISYKNDNEVSINGVKIKLPENDSRLIK
jgi:antitoxin component YwqK of YwqJK toxin-antitoxin module